MVANSRLFFALVLVVCLSLAAGCSQSAPPQADHAAKPSEPTRPDREKSEPSEPLAGNDEEKSAEPGEAAAPPVTEGSKDSGVKLATAEGPVRATKEPTPAAEPGAPARLTPEQLKIKAPLPLDNVETGDLTMPPVKLTDHHAKMSLVKVGDPFPALNLADSNGQAKPLAEALGDKVTLVFFWNAQEHSAIEQLGDLARYHQPRLGEQGLTIVAVNTGDPAARTDELAKKAGANFTVLCDVDGSAFKQVATAKLPRSYLLDKDGKVLWFDLEYSATTRRDMVQAIRFSLAHLK